MLKKYFTGSIIATVIGLIGGIAIGYYYTHSWSGAMGMGILTLILAVLEVSLSFDNAVVNASVLKNMTPEWRHRFLTWGILIAVFGMRIIFPLAVVAAVADISPWSALEMAALRPEEYAQTMLKSHILLSGFGGAFLLMVAFKYFFDTTKNIHWIQVIEKPLVQLGRIEAIGMGLCLGVLYVLGYHFGGREGHDFLVAGITGIIVYVAVDAVGAFLQVPGGANKSAARASLGMFLYLEVLDASFSFDGVIGAFAVTHNLFLIAIGLAVGAMFVRSLTVLLVDKGTLAKYRFLEHGAFYAIGALALLMFLDPMYHLPEMVTGLVGAGFILLALVASIRFNRRQS